MVTHIGFLFGNYGRFRENVMTLPIIANHLKGANQVHSITLTVLTVVTLIVVKYYY